MRQLVHEELWSVFYNLGIFRRPLLSKKVQGISAQGLSSIPRGKIRREKNLRFYNLRRLENFEPRRDTSIGGLGVTLLFLLVVRNS